VFRTWNHEKAMFTEAVSTPNGLAKANTDC
jgi:hypothetical protein